MDKNRQRLESAIILIGKSKDINPTDKKLLIDFLENYNGNNGGISLSRRIKYAIQLRKCLEWMDCSLKELDESHFNKLRKEIENGTAVKKHISAHTERGLEYGETTNAYSPATIYDYKTQLKTFFKWLQKKKGFEFPDFEYNIKITRREKTTEDVLTHKEIAKLKALDVTLRNKALIEFLLETGVRPMEFVSLTISDLHMEEDTPYVLLRKTKGGRKREIAIIDSVPIVTRWLASHPKGNDPDAQLFCRVDRWGKYGVMSEQTLGRITKTLFKEAGIPKSKRIPYTFRHTAITLWGEMGMTEQQIKYRAGHVAGSRMLSTYVHIRGKEARDGYSEIKGVKRITKKDAPENIECVCGRINKSSAGVCSRCMRPLSLEVALQSHEEKQKQDQFIEMMLADPVVRQKMVDTLTKTYILEKAKERGIST